MLQDAQTIRYYQGITDAFVELWNRGYQRDDMRMYLDGFLAALRQSNTIEPYLIHRLEEEASRFMYDSANFAVAEPEPERQHGFY